MLKPGNLLCAMQSMTVPLFKGIFLGLLALSFVLKSVVFASMLPLDEVTVPAQAEHAAMHDLAAAEDISVSSQPHACEALTIVGDAHAETSGHCDHALDHDKCNVCLTFFSAIALALPVVLVHSLPRSSAVSGAQPFATYPFLSGLIRPPNQPKA